MTKSFWTLLSVSPGFQTEHILTARLSLPPQYTNGSVFGVGQHRRISAFQRELLDRVRGIPGVILAAFTAYLPLSGTESSWAFDIEGRPPRPVGVYNVAYYRPVSSDYFQTIGIPILRGCSFAPSDDEDSPLVAIINESMVPAFWGQQNPVGQRVRFSDQKWRTIVGVVGDVHHESLGTKPEPEMYAIAETKAGAQPSEILLVDDDRTNLMAAEHAGWHVLWFDDYRPDESILRIRDALTIAD